MRFASIALASAFSLIFVGGCGEGGGTKCETNADCGDEICGPAGECHVGLEGDPCLATSQCAYAPDEGLIFACSASTGSCTEVECLVDADCSNLRCMDDKTCDSRTCGGTPIACEEYEFDAYFCESMGCDFTGTCSGTATFCPVYDGDAIGCAAQDGCTYDVGNDWCAGSATLCRNLSDETSCLGQSGCSWAGGCVGSSPDCSTYDIYDCELMPGCSISE